MTLLPVAGTA